MHPDQKAALNIDCVDFPMWDTGLPAANLHSNVFQGPDGQMLHVTQDPMDRWYVVIQGHGFSGVVCSTQEWNTAFQNVASASGHSAKNHKLADFAWLHAFYLYAAQVLA
jgi:hypothetical protein